MKKAISILLISAFCLSLPSCAYPLEVGGEISSEAQTVDSSDVPELFAGLYVEWVDFVRIGGVGYYADFLSVKTVEASRVGKLIGEIEHNVKSTYESKAEYDADCKRANTAAFRKVGCKVYTVKDDANSIAVLDGTTYYLYTRGAENVD